MTYYSALCVSLIFNEQLVTKGGGFIGPPCILSLIDFAPPIRETNIWVRYMSVSVCLFVCLCVYPRAYLQSYASDLYEYIIFAHVTLVVLQWYIRPMYFRFYGWRHAHNGPYEAPLQWVMSLRRREQDNTSAALRRVLDNGGRWMPGAETDI